MVIIMTNEVLSCLGADSLLKTIDSVFKNVDSKIPESITLSSSFILSVGIIAALLILGFLFRILFGKKCLFNQTISTSFGIFFVFIVSIVVYTFKPWNIDQYLSPLPFAFFHKDILLILPFADSGNSVICHEMLFMVILCFIVHLLFTILPKGKKLFTWFLSRFISVILAIFLNLCIKWFCTSFFSAEIVEYAPTVILILLGASLLIGLFNPLLCVITTILNPVFGLFYTFFFSNIIGKQLMKAVVSCLFVCFIFYLMEYYGYSVIPITQEAVLSYIPFGIVSLIIWFLFDKYM